MTEKIYKLLQNTALLTSCHIRLANRTMRAQPPPPHSRRDLRRGENEWQRTAASRGRNIKLVFRVELFVSVRITVQWLIGVGFFIYRSYQKDECCCNNCIVQRRLACGEVHRLLAQGGSFPPGVWTLSRNRFPDIWGRKCLRGILR